MASSPNTIVQRAITAQNQFTDGLLIANREFGLSIRSSAISATIVLQRKLAGTEDSTYNDVASFTANAEKNVKSVGSWVYRIGCKTGGFSSATGLNVALVM